MLNKSSHSFTGYEKACEFLMTCPEPHSIATVSPRQMKYFGPRMHVYDNAENDSPEKLKSFIKLKNIQYLSIDLWSPHMPAWCRSYDFQKNGYALIYDSQSVYVFQVLKNKMDSQSLL